MAAMLLAMGGVALSVTAVGIGLVRWVKGTQK
jgi:hypothetical protein